MSQLPPDGPRRKLLTTVHPKVGLCVAQAALCVLWSGCSSFESHWKAAASSPAKSRWEGRWTSAKHVTSSGKPMGGRLRAVTETAPDGGLITEFRANWLIFASNYCVTLSPRSAGAGRKVVRDYSGTHELPKMYGGTYRYEARVSGDQLDARYDSSYDHGTFALKRVVR